MRLLNIVSYAGHEPDFFLQEEISTPPFDSQDASVMPYEEEVTLS